MAVRALLVIGAAVASYRLLAYQHPSEMRAARLCAGASRTLAFLLLVDVLLLPMLLEPTAGFEARLLSFTVAALVGDAALRSDAVVLAVLGVSALGLGAEGIVRTLVAFRVPGIAVNRPGVLGGLSGRSPGAAFEWTGQAGFPKEFRTSGRWNRWGFNDRDPPTESTEPVVLVVGDSYVEGLQVAQGATFFRVAEERLRGAGHGARVVGLGESGSGACGAQERLEQYGDRLRPAVVVYAFVYNDVRNDYPPWERDAAEIEAELPALLSARFLTFVPSLDLLRFRGRLLARAWLAAHRSRQGVNPDALMLAQSSVGDVSSAWEATLGCVDRMSLWSRARGAAFVVLELPPGSPLYLERMCSELRARGHTCDPEGPRRRLAEDARRDSHAFLTPVEEFRKAWQVGERLEFRWDGHYNSEGHRLAGQVLGDGLRLTVASRGAYRLRDGTGGASDP